MNCWQFHVPHLPDRVISSNTWSDNRKKALAVHAEKEQLAAETMMAFRARYGPELPLIECCAVQIVYLHTFKRPGDGLLRLTDPGNVGGTICKAVLDALTPESKPDKRGFIKKAGLGVIPDDDWKHIKAVTLVIDQVAELSEEGILVTIQELVGGPDVREL